MSQRRRLVQVIRSKFSIQDYLRLLTVCSVALGVVVFVFQVLALPLTLSEIEGFQIIETFWMTFSLFILGGIFFLSGEVIVDQISTEKALINEQIDQIMAGNFEEGRPLREKDELRDIMDKVLELKRQLKSKS